MRFRSALITVTATSLTVAIAHGQTPLPSFTEVTSSSGLSMSFTPTVFANWDYCGGGAVADFNRDGFQDVYLCKGFTGGGLDRLCINNGDGTFTDQAAQWGLTQSHNGKGAAAGDYDGDGDLDLYVTSAGGAAVMPGQHKLFRNNGDGTFTDVAGPAGVAFTTVGDEDGFGAAFGDYDLDGDLDLFVAGFAPNNNGTVIFQNQGDGTFLNVTTAIGFFDTTPINLKAFAPRFADMNGDFYPEVLLAADFGTSRYYLNNGDGTFTDITEAAGVGLDENGMGQTIGDWNNDGILDWYVTSIYLPPNGWTGNKLYLGLGNDTFTEVSQPTQTFDGGYGWGAAGVDFNHDGLMDIVETNGDSQTTGTFANEQSYLWMQVPGQAAFSEMAQSVGLVHNARGRGLITFDVENDGDQDVLILAWRDRVELFRNEVAGLPDANWLRIFFDTSGSRGLAPDGYGTRVTATVGGADQVRYMSGGDNFLSMSELSVHFGLGTATQVDTLTVEWANGQVTTLSNVAANQTLVVESNPDGGASVYCTAKTTSNGCLPAIGFSGTPSVSSPDPFEVAAGQVINNKNGLFFYGYAQGVSPFLGGTLCSQPPLRRTSIQNSGGSPPPDDCSGALQFDFNAHLDSGADPLLVAGSSAFGQFWFRDPADAFGAGLTDAVAITVQP